MTATALFQQVPVLVSAALVSTTGAFTFVAASGATTNLVQLAAGGTNGTKIESISATSTDTASQTLYLVLNDGVKNCIIGAYTMAIGAGTLATVPPVNLIDSPQSPRLSYDSSGNKYLFLPSGSALYVGTAAAITAAKQISVIACGGNF